jgi:hypothetical protein
VRRHAQWAVARPRGSGLACAADAAVFAVRPSVVVLDSTDGACLRLKVLGLCGDLLGGLRNVVTRSPIVAIPPNRHSADEKVRYCRITRRGGRLLISQQKQFPQPCSGNAGVVALTEPDRGQSPWSARGGRSSVAIQQIGERVVCSTEPGFR